MAKSEASEKGDRKLKILAVPANHGGCSYYRIIMPMEKLAQKCEDRVEVRFDLNPLMWGDVAEGTENKPPDDYEEKIKGGELENIEWADIVFCQNISNKGPQYMVDLLKICKEKNKFVHYDTDDLLTDLYEGHRLSSIYKDNKLDDLTKIMYANSDLVSVTQKKFAERVAPFVANNLVVIRNAIDFELECWSLPKMNPGKKMPCRIGWVGGIHHEQDVKQVPSIAMGVNARVGPENVHWGFYGRPPLQPGEDKNDWQQEVWNTYQSTLTRGIKHRNWAVYPAMPSSSYGAMFTQIDVAIAPLEWNEFNDSKSEIKVAECGRYGVPLVATDCGAYDETIVNGETGYLIDKDNPRSEWIKYLSLCIKDKDHRREMGQNLKKLVDERFDINNHIEMRLNLYEQLLKNDRKD